MNAWIEIHMHMDCYIELVVEEKIKEMEKIKDD